MFSDKWLKEKPKPKFTKPISGFTPPLIAMELRLIDECALLEYETDVKRKVVREYGFIYVDPPLPSSSTEWRNDILELGVGNAWIDARLKSFSK